MHLLRASAAATSSSSWFLYTVVSRHFSSASKISQLPSLSKIRNRRREVIQDAQQALTDYLHNTRYLPYTFAEHIGKNSTFSLVNIIAKVYSSRATFLGSFQRFLRYHPINEFEFFYESIGIHYKEVNGFLPANKFFLSEDLRTLNAAYALSGFGFPWNRLGELYKEEKSIFGMDSTELSRKLRGLKDYGFKTELIIAICLVFPRVLSAECQLGWKYAMFLDDLKRVLIDFDLMSYVECNLDAWYDICRKIRVFYDLDCEKGKMGELMGINKSIFMEYSEEDLIRKVDFFCRLCVGKEEVALFLLERPEILGFDLENRVISVLGFLKHCGMKTEELKSIAQKYPHVVGRHKMVNLPHVMRALDLEEWFFNKMKNGNHLLLGSYDGCKFDEDLDGDFKARLDKIESSRNRNHYLTKLNFLHGVGFGENKFIIKVLDRVNGNGGELQERFDCLLRNGIEFSKLSKMLSLSPKILNQKAEILEQKLNFLCQDVGSSLQLLDEFPAFLCYDLEKRIKPRYYFHMWLLEKGFCAKNYSLASIIATSEKNFVHRISVIHPSAPKQWAEFFKQK
ncbi:transcription termination factor MTEF18, mitochondrial [Cornus florida]|uniref:transcription termination factor MTEF18, mitochondrial n=1 Tax=Cornus florida TaxID=4283 RepID=UPI00289EED5E|nr:transcription termination factor MTEF18, mitochondrial [Cornus florida]XP_059633882.1 transcription termination factor MTEF18, mitochondrial [Cornus florida]XP_059633883.1 transcription termination factor MTEF18, mitochondrial [Cornus florida]